MRAIIPILALVFLAPPPLAAAQQIEARTLLSIRTANIRSAMGEMGYDTTATKYDASTEKLEDEQKRFTMFLGMCSAASCKMVQTRICLPADKASPDLANRWNNTQMFGRAVMQGKGVMCIDNTLYAIDGLASFAQLRSQVEGLLGMQAVAADFFAKG